MKYMKTLKLKKVTNLKIPRHSIGSSARPHFSDEFSKRNSNFPPHSKWVFFVQFFFPSIAQHILRQCWNIAHTLHARTHTQTKPILKWISHEKENGLSAVTVTCFGAKKAPFYYCIKQYNCLQHSCLITNHHPTPQNKM